MTLGRVNLTEWQWLGPEDDCVLAGRNFGDDQATRILADELTAMGRLEVLELSRGLELRATSFVGRLRLGDLTLTIEPKLKGAPFLHLLRYAYGLRHLNLHDETGYATRKRTFQDLLVQQLAVEAEELIRSGLHRDYIRREDDLASPRGRIDFNRLVKSWERGRPALPCVHYPRSEDNVLNRALLAGLRHAVPLATDADLRSQLSRLGQSLSDRVTAKPLSEHLLAEAWATMDRRVRAYESSLIVSEILLRGEGVALDDATEHVRLPGFLFDMNMFFQRLLSRFLHDHLIGYEVEDEYRIKELFCYDPNHNPKRRHAPVQKPDFVIRQKRHVLAILDAKYRDLWETKLPREMLYQLALYALGRGGDDRNAVILYPTLSEEAVDQAIVIREPIAGAAQARVVLRPLNLLNLAGLLLDKSPDATRKKQSLAHQMALGVSDRS